MLKPPVNLTKILAVWIIGFSYTSAQRFIFPDDFSLSARSSQQQLSCVTLEKCGSLMQMWESRFTKMNTLEAIGALERAHCGFLGVSDLPLFRCPDEPESGIREVINDVGHIKTPGLNAPCAGTLKLFVDNDPEPDVVTRESISMLRVVGSRVVVTGNCCWRLYYSRLFRGQSLSLGPGATQVGVGMVKSIKKLEECPEIF